MKRTQKMRILSMLLEACDDDTRACGYITPWDVIKETGCYKLATRIGELRRDGHAIYSDWITRVNRHGEPVKFKVYYMGKKSA